MLKLQHEADEIKLVTSLASGMEDTCVYYCEIGVQNGEELLHKLKKQYDFALVAIRITDFIKQWVVQANRVRFLLTEINDIDKTLSDHNDHILANGCRNEFSSDDPYFIPWNSFGNQQNEDISLHINKSVLGDSVFNVALVVPNVKSSVERLTRNEVTILKPVTILSDKNGQVKIAVVKSCIGNVIHTLIECNEYRGPFLPYFHAVSASSSTKLCSEDETKAVSIFDVDHVAFACNCGQSFEVLDWYEKCFGMKRFLVNRDENNENGFVINTADVGLRLKAFEYWKCAETGIESSSSRGSMKFVIAEALSGQGPNQIDTFLKEHGCPGIQHIGLTTSNIVGTVSALKERGVKFAEPPYTYYTEVGKLHEMNMIGLDVAQLMANGILLDAEADSGLEGEDQKTNTNRYLMQKFTRPLFERDTFFLEIIQRVGARGFGSGNITALWRSVQAYLNAKERGDPVQ